MCIKTFIKLYWIYMLYKVSGCSQTGISTSLAKLQIA